VRTGWKTNSEPGSSPALAIRLKPGVCPSTAALAAAITAGFTFCSNNSLAVKARPGIAESASINAFANTECPPPPPSSTGSSPPDAMSWRAFSRDALAR
jgi:hypothetical protein